MTPKISVVVPCYNQAQYLDECLQSVLDQTYTDWECIIVNDGSPDNTEEVAQKWTAKDSRFKYLKKENGGLSSARNAGIEMARGEWILPLDADDKIGNLYMELAEKEFAKGYTIIYCEAEFFGDKEGKWILPEFSLYNLAYNNIMFCSAFFKKKDWYANGGYNTELVHGLEDWEFWINLLKKNPSVNKISNTLFFYRIKEASMLTNLIKSNHENMIKIIERKHYLFFLNELGSYHRTLYERNYLKERNDILEENINRIITSKRYKFFAYLADFFK